MRPYARFNKGHNYILTVIDVLTKYAWAVPLKTKGGAEVARAIATILLADGRRPTNLHTDRGKEFYNVEMTRLTKKHGINHYSTYSVMKASVVERFNRTLKNAMWKMFLLNGNYKWIDALSRLIAEYNARKHRTIGMRPVDVTPAKARQLLSTVYSNIKIAAPARFKTNDPVRISKYKTIFDKGYTPNLEHRGIQNRQDTTNQSCDLSAEGFARRNDRRRILRARVAARQRSERVSH